jgi:hypothetical protein
LLLHACLCKRPDAAAATAAVAKCLPCLCGPQVRIILNKSDQVDQQQLMRVYGALMWSLGKVFKSPEVCKVRRDCYISITCFHLAMVKPLTGLLGLLVASCGMQATSEVCKVRRA